MRYGILLILVCSTVSLQAAPPLKRLQPLKKQAGGVLALAISPDGSLLAAASTEKRLHFWSLSGSRAAYLYALPKQPLPAVSLGWSDTGRFLAAALGTRSHQGHIVRIWERQKKRIYHFQTVRNHKSSLTRVLFLPVSNDLITVGGYDKRACVWKNEEKKFSLKQHLRWHKLPITDGTLFGKQKILAISSLDRSVSIWLHTKKGFARRAFIQGMSHAAACLTFHPSRPLLAAGLDGSEGIALWTWNGTSMLPLTSLPGEEDGAKLKAPPKGVRQAISCLAFSPQGTLLVAGTASGRLLIWRVKGTGFSLAQQITVHSKGVTDLAFSPDGKSCFSAGRKGLIYRWQVR